MGRPILPKGVFSGSKVAIGKGVSATQYDDDDEILMDIVGYTGINNQSLFEITSNCTTGESLINVSTNLNSNNRSIFGINTEIVTPETELNFLNYVPSVQYIIDKVGLGNNGSLDNLIVNGTTIIGNNQSDTFIINSDSTFYNNVTINAELDLNGNATFYCIETDCLVVNNNMTIGSDLNGTSGNDVLDINSFTTFYNEVQINNNLTVNGNYTITEDFTIQGNTTIGDNQSDTLIINSNTTFNSIVEIDNNAVITGNVTIGGPSGNIDTTLVVNGNASFNCIETECLIVNNDTILGSDNSDIVSINAFTTFYGDVNANNDLTVNGNVTVTDDITVQGDTTLGDNEIDILIVNADSRFNADVNINDNFLIDAESGNTTIVGNVNIGTDGISDVTLEVNGTDALRIPVGTTAERPLVVHDGYIRYNTDKEVFEGFGSNNIWKPIGVLSDIDQDTKITAETDGNDEDCLRFFTAGNEAIKINSEGNVTINTVTQAENKDTGALVVEGGVGIEKKLFVGEDLVVVGNFTVGGNQSIINTQTLVALDPLIIVGNDAVHDAFDLGFLGQYMTGGNTLYSGLVRDADDKEFKLLTNMSHTIGNKTVGAFDNSNLAYLDIGGLYSVNDIQIGDDIFLDAIQGESYINGQLMIGSTNAPNVTLHLDGTDALFIPSGNITERPIGAEEGYFRYNKELDVFEGFSEGEWKLFHIGDGGDFTNITVSGNATIGSVDNNDTFAIYSNTSFEYETTFNDNVTIGENTTTQICGDLNVKGNMTIGITGSNGSDNTLIINSITTVTENTTFTNNVVIESNTTIGSNISNSTDILTIYADSTFNNNVTINNELVINDNTTLNGNLTTINSNSIEIMSNITTIGVNNSSNIFIIYAESTFNNNVTIGNAGINGNTSEDTLIINSNTTFSDEVCFFDDVCFNSNITIGNNGSNGSDSVDVLTINSITIFNDDVCFNDNIKFNGTLTLNDDLITHGNVTIGPSNSNSMSILTINDEMIINENVTFNNTNVIINGNTTIGDNNVNDSLIINANTTICADVLFKENVTFNNLNTFNGISIFENITTFNNDFNINGNTTLNGNITICADVLFKENTIFNALNTFNGVTVYENTTTFNDIVTINEDLNVIANTSLCGNVSICNNLVVGSGNPNQIPLVTVEINGTDAIRIPVGNMSERPAPLDGYLRYNTDNNVFEGYSNNNWGSLGGIIDIDQDTKITAETSGNDEDCLRFYNAGNESMKINSDGNVTINTVTQALNKDTGALVIEGGVGIEKKLYVGEDLIVLGNFTVIGNQSVVTVESIQTNDSIIILGNNTISDNHDIGFLGEYKVGNDHYFSGLIRDANTKGYNLINDIRHNIGDLTVGFNSTTQFADLDMENSYIHGDLVVDGKVNIVNSTEIKLQSDSDVQISAINNVNIQSNESDITFQTSNDRAVIINNGVDEINTSFKIYNYNNTPLFCVNTACQDTAKPSRIFQGCVGIGKEPNKFRLDVKGAIRVSNYVQSLSDINLKTNIKKLPNCLEKIQKINGISYNWKEDVEELKELNSGVEIDDHIGVIAQEVEAQFPEIISIDTEGIKSVSYERLCPILIEAMKEQQMIINKQRADIDDIRNEIMQMKNNVNKVLKMR
jgi:hypothetical protein